MLSYSFRKIIEKAKASTKLKMIYEKLIRMEIIGFYVEILRECYKRIQPKTNEVCPSHLLCDLPRRVNNVNCTIAKRNYNSTLINDRLMLHIPISEGFVQSQNGCWQK